MFNVMLICRQSQLFTIDLHILAKRQAPSACLFAFPMQFLIDITSSL